MMKPIQTVSMSIVFLSLYTAVVSADHFFAQKTPVSKVFLLEAENETLTEQDSREVLPNSVMDPDLLNLLLERYLAGESLTQVRQIISSEQTDYGYAVRAMADELSGRERYLKLVQLCDEFNLSQRLDMKIQFRCAVSHVRQNKFDRAVQAYRDLLASQPSHQAASINLGLLLNKIERYQEAEMALLHAIEITSGTRKAKALSALASNFKARQDYQKAAAYYERSIEYRPDHSATWLKLANTRSLLDVSELEVEKTYRRALALRPEYPSASKALGAYLLQRAKFGLAIESLEAALEHSNQDEQVHRLLAWSYTEAGKFNAARRHWEWLANQGSGADTRLLASHLRSALDQNSRQLKELPHSPEFDYARAVVAQLAQKEDLAILWLHKIPIEGPFSLRSQLRLSQTLPSGAS